MTIHIKTLGKAELEQISRDQVRQQQEWRNLPLEGLKVECCGQSFTVLPNVFPPRSDTQFLVENLHIQSGAKVLDVGTGTGALAVFAVRMGARKVVAVDLNPDAVRNTDLNVDEHDMKNSIDVRVSDGFSAISGTEMFDLILANLPGRSATAGDVVEAAQWDTGFRTHQSFFSDAPSHLNNGGRILMTKANYPEINDVVSLAESAGLSVSVAAKMVPPDSDPRTYYLLEFRT